MGVNKKVKRPVIDDQRNTLADKVKIVNGETKIVANFENFKLMPLTINGIFCNYFKDMEHFSEIASEFIGKTLPKITSHKYKEICEGSNEGRILHFHAINEEHQVIASKVLERYGFSKQVIEQMSEGNDLVIFTATLGHKHPARVVCHKVDNVFYFLFLDTNHHIYMNEKYVKESLFYEECPLYVDNNCSYMPHDCYAVGYLDEKKIEESYHYNYFPTNSI